MATAIGEMLTMSWVTLARADKHNTPDIRGTSELYIVSRHRIIKEGVP